MDPTIIVFGNGDTRVVGGFPQADDFDQFIREGVFQVCGGRYRHSVRRNASFNVIVLSRQGLAHGRFEVSGREEPTADDLAEYDRTRAVYLVTRSFLYEHPVRLSALGIMVNQAGVEITQAQLVAIEAQAGQITAHAAV